MMGGITEQSYIDARHDGLGINGSISTVTNITASGNISASGNVLADRIYTGATLFTQQNGASPHVRSLYYTGNSLHVGDGPGHVTVPSLTATSIASGNISSSAIVQGSTVTGMNAVHVGIGAKLALASPTSTELSILRSDGGQLTSIQLKAGSVSAPGASFEIGAITTTLVSSSGRIYASGYWDDGVPLSSIFAPVLGSDDNYVTDAEKTVIGNTSNTNTGDTSITDSVTTTSSTTRASATAVKAAYDRGSTGITNAASAATTANAAMPKVGGTFSGNVTASGNVSSSANIYSYNEEYYSTTARLVVANNTSNYYGPNSQGTNYYYWNRDLGTSSTTISNMSQNLNSGIKIPHKIILTGYHLNILGRSHNDNIAFTLVYSDGMYDGNVTSAPSNLTEAEGAQTITLGGNNKMYELDRRDQFTIPLNAMSMLYPRFKKTVAGGGINYDLQLAIQYRIVK